jgi:hypothetical protein
MLTDAWRFASVMSSRTQIQAVALAGALNSVVVEPTSLHLRSSAPIYRRVRAQQAPLDLTANVFRYRRRADGFIEAVRRYVATFCRCKSRITQRGR